jgi:hypothetical protein
VLLVRALKSARAGNADKENIWDCCSGQKCISSRVRTAQLHTIDHCGWGTDWGTKACNFTTASLLEVLLVLRMNEVGINVLTDEV